jgi:hypothetical protein
LIAATTDPRNAIARNCFAIADTAIVEKSFNKKVGIPNRLIITPICGCSANVNAMGGLLVTMVACKSRGKCRAT